MIGGGNSYDVLVETKNCPLYKASEGVTTIIEGKHFWDYEYFMLPESYFNLSPGSEKFELGGAIRAAAKLKKLDIAKKVFSELNHPEITVFPTLWIPAFNFPSKSVFVET
jgi:hypothetical protein